MTVAVANTDNVSFLASYSNLGHGQEATEVERLLENIFIHVRLSAPYQLAEESLFEVYKEHSEENWDGEDARPVTRDAYLEAREFLKLLPTIFPTPSIVPEPTGEIAMEWYKDNGRVFLISFGGNGVITFAGMFGRNATLHGTESFEDFIPPMIIDGIRRLFPLRS
jgi:hypothetical protein